MKDMFPRLEKKGINLNDLQYFKDVKRDEALRFFSDKWAMVHNCEKNLEDILEEMVTLTKKQGLPIKQETYQMEEMNLLEREILFFLADMKKTMHPDYYATFLERLTKKIFVNICNHKFNLHSYYFTIIILKHVKIIYICYF